METIERNPRYNMITKANELIRKSRFVLSAQQQKILLFLISRIKPYDDDFKLYEFSIREFCDICGIDCNSGRNYEALKEQIKNIADKSLWITLPNGKETLLRWIEKPYIDENSGIIQIKLDNDMKPYLLKLSENFTQYSLLYTLQFKSKYSIRLYEYIQSIHYKKLKPYAIILSVDELRERIGAETYDNFKDFHTRVLKPAVKEINQYTDKTIEYELKKEKNKVSSIKITIITKTNRETGYIIESTNETLDKNKR